MYREDSMDLSVIQHQNDFVFKTFVWMVAGLLVTAACAWLTYASNLFWYFLYENTFTILLIVELVVVLLFSFLFVSLINLFLLRSTMMEIFIDCAVLFLFFGITAYDMNKIREIGMASLGSDRKLYIYGAMQLYLDFINIFLRLLALFAKRK